MKAVFKFLTKPLVKAKLNCFKNYYYGCFDFFFQICMVASKLYRAFVGY